MIAVEILVVWVLFGVTTVVAWNAAKRTTRHRQTRHDLAMRLAAVTIDGGESCPCCSAGWVVVAEEVVSIDGNEVRTRSTLNMDHDDWCEYAEWAGL